MTDMAVTAMLLFSVFAFYLWTEKRRAPFLMLAGLAVGLTLLATNSGVIVAPILLSLAVADTFLLRDDDQERLKHLGRSVLSVVLIFVIAFGVLWMGYGMRYVAHSGPVLGGEPPSSLPSGSRIGRAFLAFEKYHLLPQAYLEGFACDPHALLNVVSIQQDHLVILFGSAWKSVPLNLLIRTTEAFLALSVLSIGGLAFCVSKYRRECVFLLVTITVFVTAFLRASWNGGMRHFMPVLPFLLIITAAGLYEFANRIRWAKYALVCLLFLHAASSLSAFPNYLSYANAYWGGPRHAFKYLGGTDLGQSYFQVREYRQKHPEGECWVFTDWQWNPQIYEPDCHALGFWQPEMVPSQLHGTIIVSNSLVSRNHPGLALNIGDSERAAIADLFRGAPPADYIGGGTMVVFKGDFDASALSSISASYRALLEIDQFQLDDALRLTDYAVRLSPNNMHAHFARGKALFKIGRPFEGRQEIELCRQLAVKDSALSTAVGFFDDILRLN